MEPGAYAIMDRQWRYIHYADDTEELYNVKKDPNEWKNLASDSKFDEIKETYKKRAPKSFAKPNPKLNKRKHLIIEGETFRWEMK